CAFLDYDNDGNLDILLVGNPTPKLYRGDGKGHFTDVSQKTGFLPHCPKGGQWLGCAVGDIDNDGYPDIYLSGYHAGALWHNVGGKKFVDITRSAGIQPEDWGTSCGFADLDGAGRLDLLVANYVKYRADLLHAQQLCSVANIKTSC